MRYQAVLFDMDGTLLDTLRDMAACMNRVLRENGYPPRTMEELRTFIGNGALVLTRRSLPAGTDEAEVQRVLRLYRAEYQANFCVETVPYPGIPELLEKLRRSGIAVAVVSNKPEPTAQKLTDRFFPGTVTVGDDGVHPRKPAPDNVLRALDALGAAAERVLYVGDSEVDLATARAAGTDAAIVGWGYRDRDFLLRSGADEVLDTPEALWEKISK